MAHSLPPIINQLVLEAELFGRLAPEPRGPRDAPNLAAEPRRHQLREIAQSLRDLAARLENISGGAG